MNRTLIKYLQTLIGQKVQIAGFVQSVRDQKRMQFVILRDHTGMIQLFHEKGGDEDTLKVAISSLTQESAIIASGTLTSNQNVKLGGGEIVLESVDVASLAETPIPITIAHHGI